LYTASTKGWYVFYLLFVLVLLRCIGFMHCNDCFDATSDKYYPTKLQPAKHVGENVKKRKTTLS